LELLTSLSLSNIACVMFLRISDLCLSVQGGSSVKVMYLNSSVSLRSLGEASSCPFSHASNLGSISGSANEPKIFFAVAGVGADVAGSVSAAAAASAAAVAAALATCSASAAAAAAATRASATAFLGCYNRDADRHKHTNTHTHTHARLDGTQEIVWT
jgi:hypothetical protein